MDNSFDFESAIRSVRSKKTKDYLQEVLSTYNNHEYRSCIVMLYATTFADALEKIKTMSEVYQNQKAAQFLEKYENDRKANKAYSALEREIKEFVINTGLMNDVEAKQWEHLKDYRDYCAHPVVESDYQLISPNAEQARMHIRNMFEALFMKDAILTDSKIFDEFLQKIESFYDRNGFEEFKEYVSLRYIKKLDLRTKGRFVKNLWKFSFFIQDEECDKYRKIACCAMIWIIQSDKVNILDFIKENIDFFNGRLYFEEIDLDEDDKSFTFSSNRTFALFYFLYNVPEIFSLLSSDNQTEIKSISKKNINLSLIAPYLYRTPKEHVDELLKRIEGLNDCLMPGLLNDLCSKAYKQFIYEYNRLIIYYFYNCQNSSMFQPDWDNINRTYKSILHRALPKFTSNQMKDFIRQLTVFYTRATCFDHMANRISKVVKEKGYDIEFSDYDIDITKYINE